jgi:phage terminase Nu1 subunit (DNA packaging protein)
MVMSSQAVLNSWKEIAEYVGRGVRTLQRWEQFYSFPVHRPAGNHKSAVFAVPTEVDEWLRTRPMHVQNENNRNAGANEELQSELATLKTLVKDLTTRMERAEHELQAFKVPQAAATTTRRKSDGEVAEAKPLRTSAA